MSKVLQDLKEYSAFLRTGKLNVYANRIDQAIDLISGQKLDLGLMTIARDHQAGLLKQCEQALTERDEEIEKLEAAISKHEGLGNEEKS